MATDPHPPTRCVRLRKVLVITGDAFWGPAIRAALEDTGYYPNLVTDAQEGCRRALERAYELVILSGSIGQEALKVILEKFSRRLRPPSVIILDVADKLRMQTGAGGVAKVSILRRPFSIEDVVDATRAQIGVPWTDHLKGA